MSKLPKSMANMKMSDITGLLNKYRDQIQDALPAGMAADRLIQAVTTMITKNPKLKGSTPESMVGATLSAAILGLIPQEGLGLCYFVPYWNRTLGVNEIQFQVGYKGYIELARRSGQIASVYAHCVYEKDEFDVQLGTEPKIIHKPFFGQDKGDLIYVYGVVRFANGGHNEIVMSKEEIEELRLRNPRQAKVKDLSPVDAWKTDYPDMAKGKVLKKMKAYLPSTDELSRAMLLDEAVVKEEDILSEDGHVKDINDLNYPNKEEDGKEEK